MGDVQVTPLPVDTHTARMDLVFSLAERWTEAGEPAGIGGTVEFRTDVFDAASIQTLIERLRAGVGGDDRRPGRGGCRRWMCSMPVSTPGWMRWGNRAVLTQPATRGVDSGVVRRAGGAHPGGGGADLRAAAR